MKKLIIISSIIVSVIFSGTVFPETRYQPYATEELLKQSTIVCEGIVLALKTLDGFTFPTKVKVTKILKGTIKEKEIILEHKAPGKFVIYEAEFNKPEINQKGTFYIQENNNRLLLIGYIKK